MSSFENLTADEFGSIAVIVAEMEAEIERLTGENEALRAQVRDLEFTIGWRERNGVTRVYGRDDGGET